jgi:hypothetical protein
MAIARTPSFIVQHGSFHRSIDQKIDGWSFWSIAHKKNHLEIHFAIARSPCLVLDRHFNHREKRVHFAWLPWYYAIVHFLKRATYITGGKSFGPSLTKKPIYQ